VVAADFSTASLLDEIFLAFGRVSAASQNFDVAALLAELYGTLVLRVRFEVGFFFIFNDEKEFRV
jgi:hypothetical protein